MFIFDLLENQTLIMYDLNDLFQNVIITYKNHQNCINGYLSSLDIIIPMILYSSDHVVAWN